ncbi:hypothetical protein LCGC14_0996190 [marine sediment metagenome]|uniref:Integral membrane bound transporter domain-containing protein n=1 Tax=marine sediment metagenome TaxID=412755 RepID=A0A0F9NQV6_9ZZZZ|nr:DUF2955 domain-containing protein [Methylophaga sp.]HEC59308.1 DUF2955 domain-containing protein [Methylophaga sp.]
MKKTLLKLPIFRRGSVINPAHRPLTANEVRQCLRVAFGATLGFTISKLMGWNYGTFFTVYPMLLLGLVPVLNSHIIRQFLANMTLVTVFVLIVQGMFGNQPVPMTIAVFIILAFMFRCMSQGAHYLFGALGVVGLSMQLHFASYSTASVNDLVMSNIAASLLTVLVAMLMHIIFPDVQPRAMRPVVIKPKSNSHHEVILASTIATLSFVVFQVLDLQDSLSAQVSSVLILFPLNLYGAGRAAFNRAIGTLIGCNVGLAWQLVLLDHSGILWFVSIALWISIMLFARHHMLEGGGSGAGFGAMTTMGILFGQYLSPQHDLVYNTLYRFTSVSVSVAVTLIAVYLMHRLLNKFESTRFIVPTPPN